MKVSLLIKRLKAFILVIFITSLGFAQATKTPLSKQDSKQKDDALEISSLLNDLQSLERETQKFSDPLAEALAKAEIADAAWPFDRTWAKKLLRAAYELALPKTEQGAGQDRPAGSVPPTPSAADRARQRVRRRVLEIARRDKDFASELIQLEQKSLGAYGKHYASAIIADQALMAGDTKAAADYILQGIEADPTQITAPYLINGLALRDRRLADDLILRYLDELRRFPLSSSNQSDVRTFYILSGLVSPYLFNPAVNSEPVKIDPPGPEVMRAYIGYMLETLGMLEQKEPGYLQMRRRLLLSLWIPLQQYAPDLATAFLNLESHSRRPGEPSSLPTAASLEEERRSSYERRIKDGLNGDQPAVATIYSAISRGDFDKARKLIDKLSDESKKKQLSDTVNAEEAISLAAQGKVYEAETLAGKLNSVASITRVYPTLISKCFAKKDQLCANTLVSQALRQIKTSDLSPPVSPEGIPASAVVSDQRVDPVLSFIAKLALEVFPYNADLAFDMVNELVSATNAHPIDAEQGQTVFDMNIFKQLARKDEFRTEQAAYSLRNRVQQVLALTAIYQSKAERLSQKQAQPAKGS